MASNLRAVASNTCFLGYVCVFLRFDVAFAVCRKDRSEKQMLQLRKGAAEIQPDHKACFPLARTRESRANVKGFRCSIERLSLQ